MCNQNILLSDAKEAANSAEMSPPSYSILVDYKNERKEKEKATYDRCQTQSHLEVSIGHRSNPETVDIRSKLHPVIQELQMIHRDRSTAFHAVPHNV